MLLENLGTLLTFLAASLAALVPGVGSAKAVGSSGEAAVGVLAEDPSKFGKVLILQALPGTQGIYGLLSWFMIMSQSGILGGASNVSWLAGLSFLIAALPIVIVGYLHLFVGNNICRIHQIFINSNATDIIQIGFGNSYSMNF